VESLFIYTRAILAKPDVTATMSRDLYKTREVSPDEIISITEFTKSVEDYAGEVVCGGFTINIGNSDRLEPTVSTWLHDREGGFLSGLNQNSEVHCLICGRLTRTNQEFILDHGVMDTWNVDAQNDVVQMRFHSGIARLNSFDDLTDLTDNGAIYLNRSLYRILNDIKTLANIQNHNFDVTLPTLIATEPFWSYIQKPERRWAYEDNNLPDPPAAEPVLKPYCIAYGAGKIFTAIDKFVMSYTPSTDKWAMVANLVAVVGGTTSSSTQLGWANASGFRIESMAYVAGPKLRLLIRTDMRPTAGEDRSLLMFKCAVIEVTL